MLYALLLLGLLPAAFMFDSDRDDDDADPPEPAPQPQGAAVPAGDDPWDGEPDAPPPMVLEVPQDAPDSDVTGFRPGTDRLILHLGAEETVVRAETDDEGNACLLLDAGAQDCLITFVGLPELPLTDIDVALTDPTTGETTAFALAEVIAPPAGPGEEVPLEPEPGDRPDTPAGAGDEDVSLEPEPGDRPDYPTGPGDEDVPLEPEPGDVGDVLSPEADLPVPGPTGADGPYRAYGAPEDSPAEVIAFAPGEDLLHITLDPALHDVLPVVAVHPAANGADGEVTIDGRLVAVLRGGAGATPADLQVALGG